MASRNDRTLTLQILAEQKGVQREVQEVNKTLGGLTKTAKAVGVGFAAAFTVDTVVDFAKGAISAASDLAEAQSKVNVVFEDSAKEIEAWSRTASTSMGLSQTAALQAAGTFGNLFDAMGLSNDAATDMSKGIVQLAADLGSFNNVGTEEVLLALQSGLLGEAEPMRRFGSALSAARVEAHALAKGWVQNKKDLTEAMKVQARYELILADTVNAQGDFARTADGMANRSKTAAARAQELTTEVGKLIAPIGDIALGVGLSAIDTVGALGGAFHDLWRFMDPGQAKLEDTQSAIRQLADEYGVAADDVIEFTLALDEQRRAQEAEAEAIRKANEEAQYRHGLAAQAERDWRALNGVTEDAILTYAQQVRSSAYVTEQMRYQRFVLNEAGDAWLTFDEAAQLANGTLDTVNKQLEEGRKAILDYKQANVLWASSAGAVTGGLSRIGESADEMAPAVRAAVRQTTTAIESLDGTYKQAVRDAKDFEKDWRHALANPEKGEGLANRLREQMETAMRRRNKALRTGNREAFAVADREVTRLQNRLNDLEQREYQIGIRMNILGGITGAATGGIKKNAAGTSGFGGGWSWVGERGPELMRLPMGTRILDNRASMTAAGAASSTVYNINVSVSPTADQASIGQTIIRALQAASGRDGGVGLKRALAGGR